MAKYDRIRRSENVSVMQGRAYVASVEPNLVTNIERNPLPAADRVGQRGETQIFIPCFGRDELRWTAGGWEGSEEP